MKKLPLLLALIFLSQPLLPLEMMNHHLVLQARGEVCFFCSRGFKKVLKDVNFLNRSEHKDGVRFDTKKDRVTLFLKRSDDFSLKKIYEASQTGGFLLDNVFIKIEGVLNRKRKDTYYIESDFFNQRFQVIHKFRWEHLFEDYDKKVVVAQGLVQNFLERVKDPNATIVIKVDKLLLK